MIDKSRQIRVLGKGGTAKAIKSSFVNAILYDDSDFSKYDKSSEELTVVSPGIPPYNSMVENSKNIISEYDLFVDDMPLSIWISGTNGKTTTTQMTQHILEDKNSVCGGNIGVGLGLLDKEKSIWILETSSFTLHYTKYAKPDIYLLLPINQDHLSWYGDFSEYEKAKLKALDLMYEGQIAVIPKKYEEYKTDAFKIVYENSEDLCKYFAIDKSKIKFNEPFLTDALLALIAKKILFDVIDYEKINTYKLDSHKVEEFIDNKKRVWVDDSKATNVDATSQALSSYIDRRIHLILGGDDKGMDIEPLFVSIKDLNIKIYAIGTNATKIEKYCKLYNIEVENCKHLSFAVESIEKNLTKNEVAILSPAAASLDQFDSYKQRGEEFKKFVYSLS